MITILQTSVYVLIRLFFLPATLVATLILNYKALVISRKFGVDYTAEKVLQLRCKMHLLGVRTDKASFDLYQALPVASVLSLKLLVAPAKLTNKITKHKPLSMTIPDKRRASILQYIYVRTVEFDRIFQTYVPDIEQIVVMGAGYDLRILNYTKEKGIKAYELDQEPIQQLKKQCLNKIGLKHDWITYVPVNFNKESWSDKLLEMGFEPSKKTFFLWEGVASYLDENVVIRTLQTLKSISHHVSIVSFDYNSSSYNEGKGTFMERTIVRLMRMTGKVFLFGIDTSDASNSAKQFLQKCGLKLISLTLIGQHTTSALPFSGLIEATTMNSNPSTQASPVQNF